VTGRPTSTEAAIVVSVKPGSRRPGISVLGDAVEVRVGAPARDGLANEAVRRAVADAARCPLSRVTLVRGASARVKTFVVRGVTREELLLRLRAAASASAAGSRSAGVQEPS
jgi:uncharacterized protein YggU (UPF0235/DUF167 family)